MRRWVGFALSCGALALACGSSKSTGIDDEGEAGAGGSGAASGASGSAGSSSGSGGTSGSMNGGTSGATNGGTAGVTGGGGATGGATTGGTSATGGSAGAGGRGYRPPDHQIEGCIEQCDFEAAAMCSAETTHEKCVEDCEVALLFETCASFFDPVFTCVHESGMATCNAEGEAVFADCVGAMTSAISCIFGDGMSDELDELCSAHCTASAEAMCANGGDLAGCRQQCGILASAFPVCAPRFRSFLECGAQAEQTCDADGQPAAPGCAALYGGFIDCLDADYGWQPGFGIVQ